MFFFSSLTSRRSARVVAGLLFTLGCVVSNARAQSTPYTDLGGGLEGGNGTPQLEGYGSLYPGTTTMLHVTEAAPQQFAILSLSFVRSSVPVFGGYAQTLPSALTINGFTDDTGHAEFPITLPAGLPGPLNFFVEVFVIDSGAPQSVAITNTLQGTTVPESAIPDAAVFYDTARTAAYESAMFGHITFDLYNYLASNPAYFDSNPAAVLDAMTPLRVETVSSFAPQNPQPYPGGGSGGTMSGGTWEWKNLFGVVIATAKLQVPWSSDGCHSTLGAPSIFGSMPLGSITAHQVGNKWTQSCPPKEQCHGATSRECGNFQMCWKQTFVWFLTLTSGCTKAETFCAPCP